MESETELEILFENPVICNMIFGDYMLGNIGVRREFGFTNIALGITNRELVSVEAVVKMVSAGKVEGKNRCENYCIFSLFDKDTSYALLAFNAGNIDRSIPMVSCV